MIKLEIKGTVKDIIFVSEKSCKFIVVDEDKDELLFTITSHYATLIPEVKEGLEGVFKGVIKLYKRVNHTHQKLFLENSLYVNSIE